MADKRTFFAWLERALPERQILIRDGGRIRDFVIRPWHQLAALGVVLACVLWSVVASLAYMHGRDEMAAREREIARESQDLEGVRASYAQAFESIDEFQKVFTKVTCEINDIQNSLLHVADRSLAFGHKSGAEPTKDVAPQGCGAAITALPGGRSESVAAVPLAGGDTQRVVGSLTATVPRSGELRERVARLAQGLEALKQSHGAFLRRSADIAAQRVGALEHVLARAGVDANRLGVGSEVAAATRGGRTRRFGTGGPFVPRSKVKEKSLPAGFDPVALFNDHADRLDNLIEALRYLPLEAPLEGYEVTSAFGSRSDPFNEMTAFHEGIDLGAPTGSPAMATGDGHVVWAGWREGYGNVVEIDHGHGVHTRYAHLSRVLVRVGEKVERGRPIGLVGSTGRSTGPHLHYEVRLYGHAVDPMKFIKAGQDVLKRQ